VSRKGEKPNLELAREGLTAKVNKGSGKQMKDGKRVKS